LLKSALFGDADAAAIIDKYDITQQYDSPRIKDQQSIGSCTANAGAFMFETYVCVSGQEDVPLSRIFLYKVARNLLREAGDVGCFLRTTMQALATFGVPPEGFCPYDTKLFDEEPRAFLYAMAQNDKALTYYRLDPPGIALPTVVDSMKVNLAANRALVLGFTVYSNMGNSGDVALPGVFSRVQGGHAICLVGYDDAYRIGDSVGAFKFANSWTAGWGHAGYGFLPYDFILKGLASDVWAMMSASWLQLDCFR
jgi:C1A family cysteine protease